MPNPAQFARPQALTTHVFRRYAPHGLAVALLLALGSAWAQNSAGQVMAVSGLAKATDPQGRERMLEKGAELFAGDRVQTADATLVQVRLHDGGYLSVRPNTTLVIDRFEHDQKEPDKSSFLVSLLRGGFRSITGLIGRSNPSGYQIRSATATVGIRGTDHEPVLVLDTPDAQLQTQAPPGLYDKVNDGETFITSNAGVLALKRGDVGFAPLASNLPPQVLLKIPDFYKMDLKTDARDPKEGGGPEGGKGAGNNLLRPSVAARREAMAGAAAAGTAPAANPAAPPQTQPTAPAAAPVAPTTPLSPTRPVLTPEQKRTILQTIVPNAAPGPAPAPSPTQR